MRFHVAVACLVLFTLSVAAPTGAGRPVEGVYAKATDVAGDGWTVTKRFRGGERASVQVVRLGGEDYVETTVRVSVYDDKNNRVVEAKGRPIPAKDLVAVIWYPPRDADYRIVVGNTEAIPSRYFVAIR